MNTELATRVEDVTAVLENASIIGKGLPQRMYRRAFVPPRHALPILAGQDPNPIGMGRG